MPLVTLKRRSEFLRIRGGVRWSSAALLLEGKSRSREASAASDGPASVEPARFGFTVTKKLGNAVVRNRIRRRLREIVRTLESGTVLGLQDCDYVIVARDGALRCPPERLRMDIQRALEHVNRKLGASRR